MDDLTLLYITANEMPQHWMDFQSRTLLEAAEDTPIVAVSRKPWELGPTATHIIEDNPKSYWNIYTQMLVAAKLATTPYVAMVEDDVLYSREHFTEFRPPTDTFAYNRARWSLFSWSPVYCLRQRISNCSLIAPRKLLIEALTERQEKHPNGASDKITGEVGRTKVAQWLGVTDYKSAEWWSTVPIIQLNHPTGSDDRQTRKWKKHGQLKAYDIPYWGKTTEIVKHYVESE